MKCTEFKAIAASFAIGACDPDEEDAADAHLSSAEHDGCFEELRKATDAAALLSKLDPPLRPDPQVWDRIAGTLFGAAPSRVTKKTHAPIWAFAALVATAVLVVALAFIYTSQRERLDAADQVLALMSQPSAQVVAFVPQVDAAKRAALAAVIDRSQKKGIIVAQGLRTPPGKAYALWVIRGEVHVAAGQLRGDGERLIADIDAALLTEPFDALAVTLEPRGEEAAPSGPVWWRSAKLR
jgi:anti-sigma-K factor RskA